MAPGLPRGIGRTHNAIPEHGSSSSSEEDDDEYVTMHDLDHDWVDVEVRSQQRRNNEQILRDCPEDHLYEQNRQRYLRDQAERVAKAKAQVGFFGYGSPTNMVKGSVSSVAGAMSATKEYAVKSTAQAYYQGGVAGVAMATAGAGLGIATSAARIATSFLPSNTRGNWYGGSGQDILERQTRDGGRYRLPDAANRVPGTPVRRPSAAADIVMNESDGDSKRASVNVPSNSGVPSTRSGSPSRRRPNAESASTSSSKMRPQR